MKMHPAKTKYSIISTRQKIANSAKQSLDLSVDGMQLTKVESERVLGVYIDHLTISPGTNTLTHCAENYFKELQFYQELGKIYQPKLELSFVAILRNSHMSCLQHHLMNTAQLLTAHPTTTNRSTTVYQLICTRC